MKKHPAQQLLLHLCACFVVITLLLLSGLNFETFKQNQKVLGTKTETAHEDTTFQIEENFWTDFLMQNPNYFEGWIELTRLYIAEGSKDLAYQAFSKALQLNPNSFKIKNLENTLNEM